MSASVVLLTLLLAPGASEAAPAPSACQSFSREAQALPRLVSEWFAHSADERVVMCPQRATPSGELPAALYFGEGPVSRHGGVCSYASHGLALAGGGAAARLERYERSEALDMALAAPDCPRPHGGTGVAAYVETYDITAAIFEEIMRLWSAATAGLGAGVDETCCAAPAGRSDGSAASAPVESGGSGAPRQTRPAGDAAIAPEAREHIDAALGPDHLRRTTVTRIVRIPGSVLRHRYAMFLTVTDPGAASPALYVVYVDKHLHGPYAITAFAETN